VHKLNLSRQVIVVGFLEVIFCLCYWKWIFDSHVTLSLRRIRDEISPWESTVVSTPSWCGAQIISDISNMATARALCNPLSYLQNDSSGVSVRGWSCVAFLFFLFFLVRGRVEFGRPASPGLQLWRLEGDRPCSLDFSSNLHPGCAKGVGNVKGVLFSVFPPPI